MNYLAYQANLFQRYPQFVFCKDAIEASFQKLVQCFKNGGKLLIAGNGGSASDADHIAGELLKSFCGHKHLVGKNAEKMGAFAKHLQAALPAIPLSNLSGIYTAFSNDCEPEWAFAQLVYALGNKGDILLGISTSGNSSNIKNALLVARQKGILTLGLTGKGGGVMKELCDVCICVPETETYKIQELHLPVYHGLCQMLETYFQEFPIEI